MKKILLFPLFLIFACKMYAQQQTFDITTYTAPNGWKKQAGQSAVQLSQENTKDGSYCMITLFKSIPGTTSAKENFDAAWGTVVTEMVKISGKPDMQPASKENGWEVLSGFAPFESEGQKGIALLVTSTGYQKMVNILVLTNTNTYEQELTAFLESVTLEKPSAGKTTSGDNSSKNSGTVQVQNSQQSKGINSGFAFNTTNWDDGWTSTVQEDWVQVTKGDIKVLIHYPNQKADAYNPVLMDGLKNAWNVLVAPRYSSAANFEFKPISGWQSIEFAEADMVEKATSKRVHVVLFKYNYSGGNGKFMEFITADKSAYEKEFGPYHAETYGWEKTENMANYNKFAVAATDLKGKWTNNFTGLTQYVNANTGASAGADTHASNQNYEFATGNTYKWSIGVASGFVGNIKFQSAKSNGKFYLPNNWQINFSDIEGKPRTYNIYFTCIKGARVLWIDNTGFGKTE